MKLLKFTEQIVIKSNATFVFDITQDYNKRLHWDTFLTRAELIEGAEAAERGVKAYCVAKNGLGMVTEYITFNRPKVTAIKMIKGPYLFKSFLGSWTYKEIDLHTTEIIFLYSFCLRFPFNLFPALVRNNLQNNVKQRLKDLKMYIEKQPSTI